jgi:hypothetical protein
MNSIIREEKIAQAQMLREQQFNKSQIAGILKVSSAFVRTALKEPKRNLKIIQTVFNWKG